MKFERYGIGIAKGMALTFKHLFRKPITTQYPEEKLTVSRRIRGTELAWSEEKCTGCYTCARSCPHGCIDIETNQKGSKYTESAPCTQACPSGVDAARYIRLIADGKPAEAVAVIRERIPLPAVCGYICAHPCESACTRSDIDQPIAIRMLKRFAVDNDTGVWKERSKVSPPNDKKVAIIGSGPAGLTAAYYLAKLSGYSVTIFEALPEAGGMMRYGIPEFRLPRRILNAEIQEITNFGVEIKTNSKVDDPESLLKQGHDALFIAIGAQQATEMRVDGEDSPGVLGGAEFLREVHLGKKVDLGNRVAVIGGGNTAMDSARTALRVGAKEVTIVYRRTHAEMPAASEEIEEALHEGISIHFLAAPTKVASQNGELKMECICMKLGAPDASGRRRPEPIVGSEFTMSLDNIISAIGQRPELPASLDIETTKWDTIEVDSATMATKKTGIFAGGDDVLGPATVIEAIAAGRQAAISIDKYLGGNGDLTEILSPPETIDQVEEPAEGLRPEILGISREQRISFDEVEVGWDSKSAVAETRRCLKCDLTCKVEKYELNSGRCIYCGLCVESCPFDALYMGRGYERGTYRLGELILGKEDLLAPDKRKPSAYFHPELEETLPKQSLLIDRDKEKNNGC